MRQRCRRHLVAFGGVGTLCPPLLPIKSFQFTDFCVLRGENYLPPQHTKSARRFFSGRENGALTPQNTKNMFIFGGEACCTLQKRYKLGRSGTNGKGQRTKCPRPGLRPERPRTRHLVQRKARAQVRKPGRGQKLRQGPGTWGRSFSGP